MMMLLLLVLMLGWWCSYSFQTCCKLDGFSSAEHVALLSRSESVRGASSCAPPMQAVCASIKRSECASTATDAVWSVFSLDRADACGARCEAAVQNLTALGLPYTPICCRLQGVTCSMFVSTTIVVSIAGPDLASACAAVASLDLDRSGCVDAADRLCAQQFFDTPALFDAAAVCTRDPPPGCCADVDQPSSFASAALDATYRVLSAADVGFCFSNVSQLILPSTLAVPNGYDCGARQGQLLVSDASRGEECLRSTVSRFDATRVPAGMPLCIALPLGGVCALFAGFRPVKSASMLAYPAYTVAQLDVNGDGCVGAADFRCRAFNNELLRRAAPTRLPTCPYAARLVLSHCLINAPPFPYREWRDRTMTLFMRSAASCAADSVPVTESVVVARTAHLCSGPTVAFWPQTYDENTCASLCTSSASSEWPIDAVLCCEWRITPRDCRLRLGTGKVTGPDAMSRDLVSATQLAQWGNRGSTPPPPSGCATTIATFALTGIALSYPRYTANITVDGVTYANEEPYAGGLFARAAAVDALGEAAVAAAEQRCTPPLPARCCRPKVGAPGAPSAVAYEALLDVVLPSNATCLAPRIHWQRTFATGSHCASDAVVVATERINNLVACMDFCLLHTTDAPFLELCCGWRNSDCIVAVGTRVPTINGEFALVGATTRFLDVTGDGCVNADDLRCAVLAVTAPSRVPECPTLPFDLVAAECCRDDGWRSPQHVWAAFNGSTPATRCAINGCLPFANDNKLCRYAQAPLAVWNATNSNACLALCRAAQFGNGTLVAFPQLCCQFTVVDSLCTLALGDVESAPGGIAPIIGDRATTCVAPSGMRSTFNSTCMSLNSIACLVTSAPLRICAPLPLPTACCALSDAAALALPPGDIDGDGVITPIDVAMVARGAFATLPAQLVAAGPQCAATRNSTTLVCGAAIANATCEGTVIETSNNTVRNDPTCRGWCEARRPPLSTPLVRFCCQTSRANLCSLLTTTALPVVQQTGGASAMSSVCVHRALLAAAPDEPRVPTLLPSAWNSMVAPPSGASVPGCITNADVACAVGRLARRNDAHNCTTTVGTATPSTTGSSLVLSGGNMTSGQQNSPTITTSDDDGAITTPGGDTDLIGPLVGVGVGALVLGILIGLLICCFVVKRSSSSSPPTATSNDNAPVSGANNRTQIYGTMPRNGNALAYVDLPAEHEVVTARAEDSDDDGGIPMPKVEYTTLPGTGGGQG